MRLPYKTNTTVRVTSPFGPRTLKGVTKPHKGVDLVGASKTLVAPCDGVVAVSTIITNPNNRTSEWGNYIRIDTPDGLKVYMCHMKERKVKAGDKVKVGDVVGIEGSTGESTGSHCHFEIRNKSGTSIDPTPYLGIQNGVGTYTAKPEKDYAALVCEKCGFEAKTKAYLDKYQFADDLWRKLWEAME